MPLCQPIRNRRAKVKVFEGTADIGYNSTKKFYLGERLHDALKIDGYILWTPYRKNMKGAKQHNKRELMTIRRTIESVFSVLKYYGIENILARSVDGFQQTVEIIVLTYNISYILQRYGFSFFN